MKKFALPLSVSIISLAVIGCDNVSLKDTAKTSAANNAVIMAKTPVHAKGMVAAANPYATQAGLEILNAGGSAIDAAIAVQTTLGLVEPQSSGLGGGAFLITYDSKTGEVWNYDGRETAPAAATRELYGDLAWGAGGQFDFAENLAANGFNVPGRMASTAARMGRFVLKDNDAARAYFFLADGSTIKEGQRIKNPEYAQVLTALKSNPRALLEGPIAEAIIEEIRKEPFPGTLTLADMAAYQAEKKAPLCNSYRAHMICGPQAPSSGGIAVQSILRTLENFDMSAKGQTSDGWHHFIEASFLAYADRNQFVADPRFVDVPTAEMLDGGYLKTRADLIKPDRAIGMYKAGDPAGFSRGKDATPDSPGTSHLLSP